MRTPTHVTTRPIVPPSLAAPATARSAGRSVALDRLRGLALVAMLSIRWGILPGDPTEVCLRHRPPGVSPLG